MVLHAGSNSKSRVAVKSSASLRISQQRCSCFLIIPIFYKDIAATPLFKVPDGFSNSMWS